MTACTSEDAVEGPDPSAIRDAIAKEQYAEALHLWTAYTAPIQRAIEARSVTPERMQELRELYTWSRTALLIARAHLRDRYHALEVAAAYRKGTPR